MAFEWKSPKDRWKGEGIYHLTFVVAGRRPLLGELVPLGDACGEVSNHSYGVDVECPDNTDGLPYEGWRKELCVTELATMRLSAFCTGYQSRLEGSARALLLCGY